MGEVSVDSEKLAYGLERGIGQTNNIFASASIPIDERLRRSPCGLVSSIIWAYSIREGLPARLFISSPNLECDPSMQHVVPIVGESENQIIIDASYSQFLGYVGASVAYEKAISSRAFPPDKIIDFKLSDRELVVDWLTDVAISFQRKSIVSTGRYGNSIGDGPLSSSCPGSIREAFSEIWQPQNMSLWLPPQYVMEDGIAGRREIPRGAIEII